LKWRRPSKEFVVTNKSGKGAFLISIEKGIVEGEEVVGIIFAESVDHLAEYLKAEGEAELELNYPDSQEIGETKDRYMLKIPRREFDIKDEDMGEDDNTADLFLKKGSVEIYWYGKKTDHYATLFAEELPWVEANVPEIEEDDSDETE
jgi:hypothetical protein